MVACVFGSVCVISYAYILIHPCIRGGMADNSLVLRFVGGRSPPRGVY